MDGVKDSTAYWKLKAMPNADYQTRILCIIILKGIGRLIYCFKSKEELFIDIVIGMCST